MTHYTDAEQDKLVAEIKERAEKATPGPWDYSPGDVEMDGDKETPITGAMITPFEVGVDCGEYMGLLNEDAEFIARARTDIPALLELVAQLRAGRDEALRRELKRLEKESR